MECCNCTREAVLHITGVTSANWCNECGKCVIGDCEKLVAHRVRWQVQVAGLPATIYRDVCAEHCSTAACECCMSDSLVVLNFELNS